MRELFPAELASRYTAQDDAVLRYGKPLIERLELGWYPTRRAGWCLTSKQPLRDASGRIVGLASLSRDLHAPVDHGIIPGGGMADALEYLEHHYADAITPATLAATRRDGLREFSTRSGRMAVKTQAPPPLRTRLAEPLVRQCYLAGFASWLFSTTSPTVGTSRTTPTPGA